MSRREGGFEPVVGHVHKDAHEEVEGDCEDEGYDALWGLHWGRDGLVLGLEITQDVAWVVRMCLCHGDKLLGYRIHLLFLKLLW